ncbi:MAG: hypothetical protein E7346_00185 [Clostridiales bacterium]|nr:hypothetical protein [Clostridiales bacterium]
MKKLLSILLFLLLIVIPFSGCGTEETLDKYVSELRSDVFEGKSQSYYIRAGYGFKETPFINDGAVGEKVNALNFRLSGDLKDGATYTLSFSCGTETLKQDFTLNPVTHALTAAIEVDNFTEKEFSVNVISSGKTETVKLKSILPDDTLTSSAALKSLTENQAELIDNFTDPDGNLKAELYMRVLVKDQKPFWYVGIASGNEQLKALLVDGVTGEVLAIREIF